jgi:hypothetical protein
MKLVSDWEAQKRETGELDTDGQLFAAYAKEREDDLFSHFTFKPAREVAQNDWLKSSTATALEYAAQDRELEADRDQSMLLRNMQELLEGADPMTEAVARTAMQSFKTFDAAGRSNPDMSAWKDEAGNLARQEEVIKGITALHLDVEADRYPGVYDNANKIMADLYGEELPEGVAFSPAEIKKMKDARKAVDRERVADAKRMQADQEAALTESVLSDENLTKTHDEFKEMLWQTPGLTNEQRVGFMSTWTGAKNTMTETGVDPWKTTKDNQALDKMWMDIRNDVPLTKKDIEDRWLSGDGGTPLWSASAQRGIREDLEARDGGDPAKFTTSDPIVRNYINNHRALFYDEDTKLIEEGKEVQYGQTYQQLTAALNTAWPDVAAMDKAYDEVMAPIVTKKAQGLYSWMLNTIPPWSAFGGGGPFRRPLGHPEELEAAQRRAGTREVRMIAPDGTHGTMSAEEAKEAERHGWTRAD